MEHNMRPQGPITSSCQTLMFDWFLQELVQLKLPKLGKHLKRLHCDMTIIATDWFLCLFSTVLPAEVDFALSTSAKCHFKSSLDSPL